MLPSTPESNSADLEGLQLDRAMPLSGGDSATCAACGGAIAGPHYLAGGVTVCGSCAGQIAGSASPAATFGELFGGLVWGVGAAAIGCLIYFAVLALSGYEIGFIAIVVGWLVGKGVHRGSSGRGGWKLQTLAVALTYLAIVGSYVPLIIRESMKPDPPKAVQQQDVISGPETGQGKRGAEAAEAEKGVEFAPADGGSPWVGLGFLLVMLLALPFLSGFDNVLGWVIIAIGLFEAWKLNRRPAVEVTGPFEMNAPADAAQGAE